jgi:hypothetical protein
MMKIFTGADHLNLETVALSIVQNLLDTGLANEPHVTTFERWHGVETSTDEDTAFKRLEGSSRQPLLFITFIDGSHHSRIWKTRRNGGDTEVGQRHELGITIRAITNDATQPAQKPLRDAVLAILNDNENRVALREAGLHQANAEAGQGQEDGSNDITPVTLSCVAYSLPNP